ncbi:dihydrofolate reductase family protein [Saprospira sp. CCB-QB6]|uniref:dihydrofolate reductase family protein n=1 Tax=Saprospira sp. CCB-QB6 TaxID=3023936 RepID=UPI00234B7E79|nr:dihydrofolate reductase family protein [Saprospira sp. CCB-QB6]WCL80954.1 dihydrofolate reductase family protein [Saprospira sp. CCB-QB6]
MKIKLYIAQSLDGYIAGPNGELDWLEEVPNPKQEDFGYTAFYESVDLLLFGRKTYEAILSFGIDWPYVGKQSFIFSRSEQLECPTPDSWQLQDIDSVTIASLKQLSQKGIWLVGGGSLIQGFLAASAIDEMIISVVPCLLGEGIPLFPSSCSPSNWQLLETQRFANGIVNLHYLKV